MTDTLDSGGGSCTEMGGHTHGGDEGHKPSSLPKGGRVDLLKIPQGDINGVGEDEVTVTSGLHAQAERTNKQIEERGLHPVEA